MALLSDRPEPERPDPAPSQEPNDYALSYLFAPHRPEVELGRTGQSLVYIGAASNLLALAVYLAWQLPDLVIWQLGLALLVVAGSALAAWELSRQHLAALWWANLPAVLTGAALVKLLLDFNTSAGLVYFLLFAPGSLVMLGGALLLRSAASHK